MEKLYMKSNIGDRLKLDYRKRRVYGYWRLTNSGKFSNPIRSGKKTKYLRLLEFIKDNPGTTYSDIVKNICSCTPVTLWNGKVVPNNDMISQTLTDLKDYGLIESSRKDGYRLTESGVRYVFDVNRLGFEKFKFYKKFKFGPWIINVDESKKTIEKDKVSISEGSDSDAYPLYSDIEFYEFLKENNYKLQII